MAFHTCDEIQAFKEAFDAFDWNKSGTISYKSLQVKNHDHDENDTADDNDFHNDDLHENFHDNENKIEKKKTMVAETDNDHK